MIRLSNALVAEGREKQMWYSLSSTEERLLSIDCVLDRLIMQKKKIDARMEGELQKWAICSLIFYYNSTCFLLRHDVSLC